MGMTSHHYTEHKLNWQGIAVTVRYCADWHSDKDTGFLIGHLEIVSEGSVPLPITETGYKSQFLHPDHVIAKGHAITYVIAWLDEASQSKDWQAHMIEQRQGSLF